MAHHGAPGAHYESPDEEYRATPPGAAYEHTDAHVWIIVKFLVWLLVSALVIHVGLGFFYELLIRNSVETAERRYPLAQTEEHRLPPAPRLQQFPRNELYEFRVGEDALLHQYGWMNKGQGVVHIPVEQAMRLMVERGMPARTADPAQPPPVAGMMPSDASSGRVMERRRQ